MAVEEGAFLHAVSGRPVQRPPSEARGPRDTMLKVSTYGREQEVNHEDLELPVMGQLGATAFLVAGHTSKLDSLMKFYF